MASKGYLRHDLRMYGKSLGIQLKAAAMLRGSFIIEIVGMMANNAFMVAAWLFLFNRFGVINGWTARELIALQGINMLLFGLVMLTCRGIMDLPRHVDQGSFDNFLTRPMSVLPNLASSKVDVSAIGDTLLGLGLTIWYILSVDAGALHILLFLGALIVGAVIFWCLFILIPNSLAFYVFDSERLARSVSSVILDSGVYPIGVLTDPLRTVLLTAMPGLFVGAVQVDILRGLHWELAGLGVIIAGAWLAFSLWIFRHGLSRYESANLVGSR